MNKILETVAGVAAIVGILACLSASSTLVTGSLWIMGFDPATLFIGGMAAMIGACLAKLYQRPDNG